MRRTIQSRLAAAFCMFAALCLYAPLTLSAWPARPACCTGNHCAIPEHHHHRNAASDSDAMKCHPGTTGMVNCSMACCQVQEHTPIAPMAYVLPPAAIKSASTLAPRPLQPATPNQFVRFSEPLSPPPRA
jgi:hypothetical protein